MLSERMTLSDLPFPETLFDYEEFDPQELLGLQVRAVNRDNHYDVERLVELLETHYGNRYPSHKIYDPDYWSGSHEALENIDDLLGVIVVDGERFVAHIAIKHHQNRRHVEVLLPAIDPDYRNQLSKISHLFWKCIKEQAIRQNWSIVLHYALLQHPLSQVIVTKCFQFKETAIIPGAGCHAGSNGFSGKHAAGSTSLLTYNVLSMSEDRLVRLHLPTQHASIIQELYQPFHLNRVFVDGSPHDEKTPGEPYQVVFASNGRGNSGEPGFSLFFVEHLLLYHLSLCPQAVISRERALNYIRLINDFIEQKGQKLCLRIALDDPECPDYSKLVEDMGYRFCGIQPMVNGHDFVLFSRFEDNEIEKLSLYTKRAKKLRNYLLGK